MSPVGISPGIGPSPSPVGGGGYSGVVIGANRKLKFWPLDLTFPKKVLRGTFMRGDVWALESPYLCSEGETLPLSGIFEFAAAVSNPTTKCWKDGQDVSGTNLSGADSASGSIVTMKSFTAMTGGERYVVELTATVDGSTQVRAMLFIVRAHGDEQ